MTDQNLILERSLASPNCVAYLTRTNEISANTILQNTDRPAARGRHRSFLNQTESEERTHNSVASRGVQATTCTMSYCTSTVAAPIRQPHKDTLPLPFPHLSMLPGRIRDFTANSTCEGSRKAASSCVSAGPSFHRDPALHSPHGSWHGTYQRRAPNSSPVSQILQSDKGSMIGGR